jgi:DNA-directed RNA polymerase specialized sigma subunit
MAKQYTNRPKSIIDETMPFGGGSSSAGGKLETDYDDAFTSWKKQPSPKTRGMLLRAVDPVISTALHSYAPKGGPNSRSQARLMAMKAFESYEPTQGSLKTHLLSQLRGLQRVQGRSQQIISIPERVVLDRQHLTEEEKVLRDRLGRDPSDGEIAGATGLSLKRINYIRQAQPGVATGSIMDDTGTPFSPQSNMPGVDMPGMVWEEMIYNDLGPTNQAIMDFGLGLHGSPVLDNREIAQRLGITPSAVTQRKTKIQAMLDEQHEVF